MMQIDIKRFLAAARELPPFALPDMDCGTRYLYENVYVPLSMGKHVLLCGLDFDSFCEDDICSLASLHDDVLEQNACQSDGIARSMRAAAPLCKAEAYI